MVPMEQYPVAQAGAFRFAHPAKAPAASKHVIVTRSINTSFGLMLLSLLHRDVWVHVIAYGGDIK